MTADERRLYIALQHKLGALTAGRQRLLQQMTASNKRKIEIELARGALEYELVAGAMSILANSLPFDFPSDEALADLMSSTAQLAQAAQINASVNTLVAAFDQAIDAWPKKDLG